MTSSTNQCLVGTAKKKHAYGLEGVCFFLSLVHSSQAPENPWKEPSSPFQFSELILL